MITNIGLGVFRGRIEATTALFAGTFYMAVSTDSTAPSATDTTLAGEQTTAGLARTAVTFSHTTGTNVWTVSATFTYTGSTNVTLTKAALFDASSGGNLITEWLITPSATLSNSGDNVTLSEQITA